MNTIMFQPWKTITTVLSATLLAGCFAQPGLTSKRDGPPITNAPNVAGPAGGSVPLLPRRANPPPANISPAVAEVITLAQSGVDEAVIKSFVGNAVNQFNPSLDELIYLNDVGISGPLVAALIQQSTKAREAREQREAMAKAAAANNVVPAPALVKVVIDDRRAQVEPPPPPAPQPVPAQVVVITQPVVAVPYHTHFQESLSPYGSWVDVPTYGRCWQPAVVIGNPHWRPYSDRGRWLWTNHGWYWQSDYSWGWAPFHYGRWSQDSIYGWVWIPGDTWAPSWVSWRTCDSHIGWAPLPPQAVYQVGVGFTHQSGLVVTGYEWNLSLGHYTFVALGRFCDRNPAYYSVPVTQVKNIYNQTIVNNNYITTNNTVINQGLPGDRVAALTRQEVRKVTIRDLPTTTGTTVRPDRLEKEGAEVVIYRPQLQSQTPRPVSLATGVVPTVAGQTATAQNPNVIVGRPVTASNGGAPVITGYTTQPAPTPATTVKLTEVKPAPPVILQRRLDSTNASTQPLTPPNPVTSVAPFATPQPIRREIAKPATGQNSSSSTLPTTPPPAPFGSPRSQPTTTPYGLTPSGNKPSATNPAPLPTPAYNPAPPTTRPTFNTPATQPTTAPSYGAPATPNLGSNRTTLPSSPTPANLLQPTQPTPSGKEKQEPKK